MWPSSDGQGLPVGHNNSHPFHTYPFPTDPQVSGLSWHQARAQGTSSYYLDPGPQA